MSDPFPTTLAVHRIARAVKKSVEELLQCLMIIQN